MADGWRGFAADVALSGVRRNAAAGGVTLAVLSVAGLVAGLLDAGGDGDALLGLAAMLAAVSLLLGGAWLLLRRSERRRLVRSGPYPEALEAVLRPRRRGGDARAPE